VFVPLAFGVSDEYGPVQAAMSRHSSNSSGIATRFLAGRFVEESLTRVKSDFDELCINMDFLLGRDKSDP